MRVNVPIAGSIKVVDASGGRKGFSIQNPSAVDVFYSDDQRLLDSVSAANLPTVGHLLAAAAPVPPPVVYPWFANGRIYVRAQAAGAQVEIMVYDVDPPCQ
jgi:hypothetical protein